MGDDAGQSSGAAADAGQQQKSSGDTDAGSSGADEKVSLTKAELDARMAEVRRGVEGSLSKKYEGFDDIKRKAEEYDKQQAAQQTETEKLQAQVADAEREKAEAQTALQEIKVSRAIEAAATTEGFKYPGAVQRLIDSSKLEFEDDGTPKADSVKKALEAVATQYPDLKPTKPKSDADGGVRQTPDRDVSPGHDRLVAAYESAGKT